LPSLARCWGIDGGPHHGEDVFSHCLLTGDALSPKRKLLRLAGFLHDTGKADTVEIKNGRTTFHGHERALESVVSDLRALRFATAELARIKAVIHLHMRKIDARISPKAVRRFLAVLSQTDVSYRDYLRLKIADRRGNLAQPDYRFSDIKAMIKRIQHELRRRKPPALTTKDLAVNGADVMDTLNIPQGPAVGQVLNRLLSAVLDDPALNRHDDLITLIPAVYDRR
jgi:hypothetical protein